MVLGLMGLTIFLRWEYSLFGDPIGPLIFAIMFLFGDLLQKFLRQLACIKVRGRPSNHLQLKIVARQVFLFVYQNVYFEERLTSSLWFSAVRTGSWLRRDFCTVSSGIDSRYLRHVGAKCTCLAAEIDQERSTASGVQIEGEHQRNNARASR